MAATNTDLRGEGFNLNFWNDRRIKEIIELVKSDRELFLGIRHGSFNIYYKSMSILRVDSSFTGIIHSKYAKQYQPIYSLHKGIVRERATEVGNDDFTNGSKDEKYYAFNIDDQFIQAFIKAVKDKGLGLKSIIDKHVHNRGHGTIKKGYLEKIAQHNIIIKNNQDPASRWYCVDMEYCSPGLGFGRFDIIAISKEKNQDSRYDVALIELKYGDASYSDYGKQSNYHNAYIEALNLYDSAKKKRRYYCHIQDNEIYKVSFGAGIVGHCYNFSQFLFRNKGEAYTNLKKEICNILNLKINLDLLDNTSIDGIGSNSNSINIEDIAEKPLIYFLTVGCEDIKSSRDKLRQYITAEKTTRSETVSLRKFLNEEWKLGYIKESNRDRMLREDDKNKFFSENLLDYMKAYFTKEAYINNLDELIQGAEEI